MKIIQLTLLSALAVAGCKSAATVQEQPVENDTVLPETSGAVSKEHYDCYVRAQALTQGETEPPPGKSPYKAALDVLEECENMESYFIE